MTWNEYLHCIDDAYSLPAAEAEARLLALDRQCAAEYDEDSFLYGAMRNELGAFYKGQGRFQESAQCFRDALRLFERHAPPGDPAVATAMNNLAGALRLDGALEEAEELFLRCLDLYAGTVGRRHVLYAAGLNNLSLICLDRGELGRAAELQDAAAEILRGLPENRDEFAVSLINLGALRQKLGDLQTAEALLDEAVRLFRTELGTDTPHYHAALNGRGVVRYGKGDFSGAEQDFLAAAAAAAAMYGEEHFEARTAREHALAAQNAQKAAQA